MYLLDLATCQIDERILTHRLGQSLIRWHRRVMVIHALTEVPNLLLIVFHLLIVNSRGLGVHHFSIDIKIALIACQCCSK